MSPRTPAARQWSRADKAYRTAREFLKLADAHFKKLPNDKSWDPDREKNKSAELVAAATCLAFAVELHLKTVLMLLDVDRARWGKTHDLLRLFRVIPVDYQEAIGRNYRELLEPLPPVYQAVLVIADGRPGPAEIAKLTEAITVETAIEAVLKAESDSFRTWRYVYELGEPPTSVTVRFHALYSIAKAIDALLVRRSAA